MAFTIDPPEQIQIGIPQNNKPNEFDLPSKEFMGYDPKGTTSITGTPLVNKETAQLETGTTAATTTDAIPGEGVTLSPKVSAIARKEQAQRQKEIALKKREQELEAKLQDAEKYQQLRAKIDANDYSAADELGFKYGEYVKHELNKEAIKNPEQERVRQLEEKISQLQKSQEELEVKEYQANQALWKQEISKLVSENPDFSTIKDLKAENIVLQHVNDSFNEDNVELTAEQAAKEIEAALLERAEKFSSVSKIKNKASEAKVLGAPKTTPKTITQNMTVTSHQTKPKPFYLMSESEQLAEAMRRVQAAKLQR